MNKLCLPLLLALLAAGRPAWAQDPAPAPVAEAPQRRGPVDVLLRQRDPLGFTPEQVTRLRAIDQGMRERNRPLVEQLLRIRGEVRAERGRRAKEARPLLRQIRENNRAAMREVGTILSAEQKTAVRKMLRERRARTGEKGRRRTRPRGPGGREG